MSEVALKVPLEERPPKGLWIDYYYDVAAAKRAVRFFEKNLVHSEGGASGQPFILEGWQRRMIMKFFGWKRRKDDKRKYRVLFLFIPKKNGKALALDTPIPTPDGWKEMRDISVGDVVFGSDGRPCRVIAVTPEMHNRPCYRVSFADGSEIVADAEHEWTVRDDLLRANLGDARCVRTVTTLEMFAAQTVPTRNGDSHFRWGVENALPLELPDVLLPIAPYVLGAWLGDGTTSNATITIGGEDREESTQILASEGIVLTARPKKPGSENGLYLLTFKGTSKFSKKNSFQLALRNAGVLNNKHIPRPYLRASRAQRLALLQGLMDTDGYASKAGQCEFTTTKDQIACDVVELLCSLGFKPTIKTDFATLRGQAVSLKYRIQFWSYRNEPVFRLARKAKRLKERTKSATRTGIRKIVSIEAVPSVPVRCIQVDSVDSLYLAGDRMIPTHNSSICAGIGLYAQAADREPVAQVVCAAADKDQARLIFNMAANYVERSPKLRNMCITYKSSIFIPQTKSVFKAISKKPNTKHGGNLSCVIIDEVHAIEDRDLVDILISGIISREQPIIVYASTAGYDKSHFFYNIYEYAKQVQKNPEINPEWLSVIYEADPEKWKDPAEWRRANPNYGVSMTENSFEAEFRTALQLPTEENRFKRLRLNIWTEQDTRTIPMDAWDKCKRTTPLESLLGEECYGGLDLAANTDLNAFSLIFPPNLEKERPHWTALVRFWFPEANMALRKRRLRGTDLDPWVKEGFITLTPGAVMDYDWIYESIQVDRERYDIKEIGFDPWNARQFAIRLQGGGLRMTEVPQNYSHLSEPTKFLLGLILSEKFNHYGNKTLRWNAANLVTNQDAKGNISPDKERAKEKIDGIVASIIGLHCAIRQIKTRSIYKDRGVVAL